MPTKTFSIRISKEAPDVDSADAARWLDELSADKAPLAPDPGPGAKTIRLSLDADKVKAGAEGAREPEATFLRRLIASNAKIAPEAEKKDAAPKALVLRGNLRLRQEQLRPLVGAYDAVQSFVVRRALKAPEAEREAALTEIEKDRLAAGFTEVLNRRAPAKLAEHIDLAGLALEIAAIGFAKVDAVKAAAARRRKNEAAAAPRQQFASAAPGLQAEPPEDGKDGGRA